MFYSLTNNIDEIKEQKRRNEIQTRKAEKLLKVIEYAWEKEHHQNKT
jgi:hypothetical protein